MRHDTATYHSAIYHFSRNCFINNNPEMTRSGFHDPSKILLLVTEKILLPF